ncbi:MAG: hypothetical protein QOE90_2981 [Thermoplasmata archaeon]|jgi:hypothetical protein|nr:hypothetical protein [Thermoplasmata archaeon]
MRRSVCILFAAVLLLALAAGAEAKQARQIPLLPSKLPLDPAPAAPAQQVAASPKPPPGAGPGDWVALLGLASLSLGMLALGLAAARRARRRKPARPPRKTREGGRMRGRALAPQTQDAALLALHDARLGQVLEAQPLPGGLRVMVERPRSHPCDEVAGFLAGLMESAWAMDVRVEHAQCAGKSGPCRYVVTRVDAARMVERVSAPAARTAAASTPGWSGAARQSPPARGGAS